MTVDITTAAASTTAINGALKFSRVANSSLTIVGGNITVNAGGTLDMGTDASPIPAAVKSQLNLALGASAGQYGLIVNNGSNFTVRGSTKTPATTAIAAANLLTSQNSVTLNDDPFLMGWSTGDVVTIGPGNAGQYGPGTTEQKNILSISGKTLTLSSNFSSVRYGTWTIQVADLTRNVLVRSSGTIVNGAGGNSAYIKGLTTNATSFNLAYGEFAYLGANAPYFYGIVIDAFISAGAQGMVSSCTVRDGYDGIYSYVSLNSRFSYNLIYNNLFYGADLDSTAGNTIDHNYIYNNGYHGLVAEDGGSHSRIDSNLIYSNGGLGLWITGQAADNTAVSNTIFSNSNVFAYSGINLVDTQRNLVVSNRIYSNALGIDIDNAISPTSNHTLIGNIAYANQNQGLLIENVTGTTDAGSVYGYDPNGNSFPNGAASVDFNGTSNNKNLLAKAVRTNSTVGISTAGINKVAAYFISYNQDYDTGTIRLWGNYTLSGSTWSLDYNSQIYASTATTPKLMVGAGHAAAVCSTNDTNAVSQLITIQRIGGIWQVIGSFSGLMGTFSANLTGCSTNFPSGAPQFGLNFTIGGGAQDGDTVDFGLIAGSNDAGRQKKLLIGPTASGFQQGHSKLVVAPSGGLALTGISGAPTVMDMLPGGTYYTMVDSGAFTANFSSISNTDSNGLQLSGSAGVSISNTVFDFMGVAGATNTYITARGLTSNATMSNLAFNTSRSTASPHAYNILVTGTDTGLAWTINAPAVGPLWGQPFDFDPNSRITWGAANLPPIGPAVSQIYLSSITVGYGLVGGGAYMAEASTASNFSGAIFRSSTTDVTVSALTVYGLTQNTTYYLRAGALWGSTTFYANTTPVFAVTLASSPAPLSFSGIAALQFTVNWPSNGNPAGTLYVVNVSTDINFGIFTATAATTATSAIFNSGLAANATYYVRVQAFNSAGTPSAYAQGVVITAVGIITISANRLAGVWYNAATAIFNAQGATNYRYRANTLPNDTPLGSDPLFDGSALQVSLPQGAVYFHVLGVGGLGNNQVAHFGPINVDTGTPAIVLISAQNSATDTTPILNGGTTLSSTPRFTWPPATGVSAPVGYSVSVSTDINAQPGAAVTTFVPFFDASLTQSGAYYVKVSALTITLPTSTKGTPASMSFTFTTTPSADRIVIKNNYFNPIRGGCVTVDAQVASAGHLKIEVYNLLARRVASLVNQEVTPALYSYTWCGRNANNALAATGLYILHVDAPAQKKDYKIILEK